MKLVFLAALLYLPISAWSQGHGGLYSGFNNAEFTTPFGSSMWGAPSNLALAARSMDTRAALLDYRAGVAASRGETAGYNRIGNVNLYFLLVLLLFAVTRRALYD